MDERLCFSGLLEEGRQPPGVRSRSWDESGSGGRLLEKEELLRFGRPLVESGAGLAPEAGLGDCEKADCSLWSRVYIRDFRPLLSWSAVFGARLAVPEAAGVPRDGV